MKTKHESTRAYLVMAAVTLLLILSGCYSPTAPLAPDGDTGPDTADLSGESGASAQLSLTMCIPDYRSISASGESRMDFSSRAIAPQTGYVALLIADATGSYVEHQELSVADGTSTPTTDASLPMSASWDGTFIGIPAGTYPAGALKVELRETTGGSPLSSGSNNASIEILAGGTATGTFYTVPSNAPVITTDAAYGSAGSGSMSFYSFDINNDVSYRLAVTKTTGTGVPDIYLFTGNGVIDSYRSFGVNPMFVETAPQTTATSVYVGIYAAGGDVEFTVRLTELEQSSLFAEYLLNGDATDSAGSADGTMNGGPSVTADRDGNVGSALAFDGIDDWLELPAPSSLGSFSVSFWMKTSTSGPLTDGTDAEWYNGLGLVDAEVTAQPGDWGTALLNEHVGFGFDTGTTYWEESVESTSSVTDGAWHHVVVTRSVVSTATPESDLAIYVDGIYEAGTIGATGANMTNLAIGIGNNPSDADPSVNRLFFEGAIDDVRMYTGVLLPSEITALYEAVATPSGTSGGSGTYNLTELPSITPDPGTSAYFSEYPAYPAVASDGTIYTAYLDGATDSASSTEFALRAERLDSGVWTTMGATTYVNAPNGPNEVQLDLEVVGTTPYIAYQDETFRRWVEVMMWDGTAWTAVSPLDASGSTLDSNTLDMASDGSVLYLAIEYLDDSTGVSQVEVYQYDQSAGSWTALGFPTAREADNPQMAVNAAGRPVVLVTTNDGSTDRLEAYDFDGSGWSSLAGGAIDSFDFYAPTGDAAADQNYDIVVDASGAAVVAYSYSTSEFYGENSLVVSATDSAVNGLSSSTLVDDAYEEFFDFALATNGDLLLWAGRSEYFSAANEISVSAWDGSAWTNLISPSTDAISAAYPRAASADTQPLIVSFHDLTAGTFRFYRYGP
jgi:hypothetical protein